ncbi:hypothetical protein MAPG_04870 [Magnaporthiopsis poae ATCC 64411]|uniref:Peptidase S33 tripeptidyl aminopeptidase-like C-terminal domain-containing protein n=1 Tax=Magnaporthiopsis poae (strain ATCC 64411 / 73-15) TaxID=644358 RepID=A0A0C4DXW3_MAGP6|nr:hypothetical protein MAPG_04870 [Magnaporthiopsis poae ATCC 64411]
MTLLGASRFAFALASVHAQDGFDWTALEPSTALNFTSCYGRHRCARLSAPLDWTNPAEPARVSIAIVALPATVPQDDPSFGGTIIVNPGGPSVSGVGYVLGYGQWLQDTASSEAAKYEILSFDPRGVGSTTPRADCFDGDEIARAAYNLEDRAMGPLDEEAAVRRKLAQLQAYGRLCETSRAHKVDRIFEHMSTSDVARDMVEMVDKLEALRGKPATGGRAELRSVNGTDKTPRINYWGYSYGTILGNYFASMFPGRVGRMMLEAVVDVQDYYSGAWANSLVDTQASLQYFWDACFTARSKCAIYRSTDASPADVEKRVRGFLHQLDLAPAAWVTSAGNIVTISMDDVSWIIFENLYSSDLLFDTLARTLDEAMSGNFSTVAARYPRPFKTGTCQANPTAYTWNFDALYGISCGDAVSLLGNATSSSIAAYVKSQKRDSPDFGAAFARVQTPCRGWKIRPQNRFEGPWTTPPHDSRLVEGKPAAPLLFVSALRDPVTPLANARSMAESHPGARVLVQDTVSHGALPSPSKCRLAHIRRYFATGEVPAEETLCKTDCKVWEECQGRGLAPRHASLSGSALWAPSGINEHGI